jgi:HK97 family phage prohead protease
MIDFRKRLRDDDDRRALERFEARCGRFGERERRTMPISVDEVRDSGAGEGQFTVKGHAAVYNRKSLDLGGFQEVIAPSAFADVLDRNPDVHLLWDHDTRLALARTMSSKYQLELREDPRGLHYWARVAPTSFAADLRVLMEGGVIDQASFAFTVDEDTWEIRNEGKPGEQIVRTIVKVRDLYDATITAQGAYPQTDSQVVRAYALDYAVSTGRLDAPHLPDEGTGEDRGAESDDAAPTAPQVETPEEPTVDVEDAPSLDSEGGDTQSPANEVLRALRMTARHAVELHRFANPKENGDAVDRGAPAEA